MDYKIKKVKKLTFAFSVSEARKLREEILASNVPVGSNADLLSDLIFEAIYDLENN